MKQVWDIDENMKKELSNLLRNVFDFYRTYISLFENLQQPAANSIVANRYSSLEKLSRMAGAKCPTQFSRHWPTVNHQLKGEQDNPTIGLLICKDKDNIEAQYSLEAYILPLGISQYELSKLIPTEIKSSLPSIEEIESSLEKLSEKEYE